MLQIGSELLGRYEIENKIGSGRFAGVWQAFDTRLEDTVAVKEIRIAEGQRAAAKKAISEGKMLRHLKSPHILTLYDLFEDNDCVYLIMEYADGGTLFKLLEKEGSLPLEQSIDIISQACLGVADAHKQDVVHRDIKPANLFFVRGKVKVGDFGLAKILSGSQKGTTSGTGTLEYSAPEQFTRDHDWRVDLWALGVILYEMIAGETPYHGGDFREVMAEITAEQPVEFPETIPEKILPVLQKALTKDREERYQSADELRSALDEAVKSNAQSSTEELPEALEEREEQQARQGMLELLRGLEELVPKGVPEKPEGQFARQRKQERQRNAPGQERDKEPAKKSDRRGPEIKKKLDVEIGVSEKDSSFKPATIREITTLTRHNSRVTAVVFSPDGDTLASGSWDRTVKLWSIAQGSEIVTLRGHNRSVTAVAFSPDGATLASISSEHRVKLWDVAKRTEIVTLRGHNHFVTAVAFSPDRDTLAIGRYEEVELWSIAQGSEIATFRRHNHSVTAVAFSPDGATLASASLDEVKLWDVAKRSEITTLKRRSSSFSHVAFSPDVGMFASASCSSKVKLWDVAQGSEIATLKGHNSPVLTITFSPDGRILASASLNEVKLWDVAKRSEIATFKGHRAPVGSVAFSLDGATLASASDDWRVKLWDLKELRSRKT